jgi:hypothetical protein
MSMAVHQINTQARALRACVHDRLYGRACLNLRRLPLCLCHSEVLLLAVLAVGLILPAFLTDAFIMDLSVHIIYVGRLRHFGRLALATPGLLLLCRRRRHLALPRHALPTAARRRRDDVSIYT